MKKPNLAPSSLKGTVAQQPQQETPSVPLQLDAWPDDALLRERHIVTKPNRPGILPISSATWWRMVTSGQAPAPIRLARRVTAWRAGDLKAMVRTQGAAGGQK